jgi:glycosyltransferase involved in cell wall biosynthesis
MKPPLDAPADAQFLPAIIMPTYNNCGTLPEILNRCQLLGLPIIIVNDGSNDSTAAYLTRCDSNESSNRLCIINHSKNLGKAAALQSGFAMAIQLGCTHAVTIDTDGQLDPEDIPALLDLSRLEPRALVIGARDDRRPDYPQRSRIGRRLSNLAIRLACGVRVADSQCGLRIYPLELISSVRCDTGRYGFEAAIITLATWQGFAIRAAPVRCRYLPHGQRISHFRPWRDSIHGVLLHLRLLFMRFFSNPARTMSAR